jgi:hypothetical protein
MERSATIKAKELSTGERQWIATVLHVDLREDDEFTLTLRRLVRTPSPEQRAAARQGLLEVLDRIGERMKDVPEEEIDAAIGEAMEHVRAKKD